MLLHSICLYILKKWQRWGSQKARCHAFFIQCLQKSVSDGENIFLSCFSLRNILNLHFAAPCEGIFEAQPYFLLQLAKGLIGKFYPNWTQFENHVHCTCMYMPPFYFIDTLTDTNSTGWVDDTNQIIVFCSCVETLYLVLRSLGASLTLFSEESWLNFYQHKPHTF